jgi:hypothetical protein
MESVYSAVRTESLYNTDMSRTLRVKERYKDGVIHATSLEVSRQRAEFECALRNIKWFNFNKGGCFL